MIEKKLTVDELIKASRCCANNDCNECPHNYYTSSSSIDCSNDLMQQSADTLESITAEQPNEPLTLEELRQMETPRPLWLKEPPRGDMMESIIEPVLFNGVHCGKEERACWVTSNAHHANARTDVILAEKINFYTRPPEAGEKG